MALTDEDLARLYQDENFSGSFAGARVFQQFLFTDYKENISLSRIYKVLRSIQNYMYTLRPIRKFPRRPYSVKSFGELFQADLGQMYEHNSYNYFLLVTDIFSGMIYCEPIQEKSEKKVRIAFDKIFADVGFYPTQISTDQVIIFVKYESNH